MHANRLQRWPAYISNYNYHIEHIKCKNNHLVDFYLGPNEGKEIRFWRKYKFHQLHTKMWQSACKQWNYGIKDSKRQRTNANHEICGKWQVVKASHNIKSYYNRRHELTIENEILCWGTRICLPISLREKMCQLLHEGHLGTYKMKVIVRNFLYWPKIEAAKAPKAKLTPWKKNVNLGKGFAWTFVKLLIKPF